VKDASSGQIAAMDTRGLVAQMFMVDFTGTAPTSEVERLIAEEGVGGVILFDKNVSAPRQIASLTNALQAVAARGGRPPLLVSADQEGGPVARLREGATHFPSAMAFGAAGSEALVASAAGVTARELRAVGVRMNMAPVLDVNSNPANPVIGVRSFGEAPRLVARLGVAAVRALQAAGVIAAVKHFPGHGDTSQDSHTSLPTVPHGRGRLESVELAPFQAAIRAGVAAVMTAHVVFPALDPDHPATLSRAILTLLRERLGFAGLVITDSMAMRAITDRLTPGDAAVQAVLAGCDIVLACGALDAQREALEAVRRAAEAGRIPASQIAGSASRILEVKRRLGLFEGAAVPEDKVEDVVGIAPHGAVADRVAEAAATLVGDRQGVIPLPPGPTMIAAGDDLKDTAERLAGALGALGRTATAVRGEEVASVRSGSAIVVLIDGGRAPLDEAGRSRIRDIARGALRRGPTAVVSVGAPYGLAEVPPEAASIAVYASDPASLRAAARVLVGQARPRGHLPVSLRQPEEPPPQALRKT
jgi:beta-N-acetylhexosaminidase